MATNPSPSNSNGEEGDAHSIQEKEEEAISSITLTGDLPSEEALLQQQQRQTNSSSPPAPPRSSEPLEDEEERRRYQPRPRIHNERLLKVLLTGHEAGVLIGRGGNSVNELQRRTGSRVKVSNNTMLFPGTNMRIILIEAGAEGMEDVVKALVDICVQEYNKRENLPDNTESEITFTLALPSAAAPLVIGKRGATVNELNKETGCNIRFGRMEDEVPGVRERLARYTGRASQILAAVIATLELLYQDNVGRSWMYDNKSTIYDVHHAPAPTSAAGSSRRAPDSSFREDSGRYMPRDPRQYSSRPLTRLEGGGDLRYEDELGARQQQQQPSSSSAPPPPSRATHHHHDYRDEEPRRRNAEDDVAYHHRSSSQAPTSSSSYHATSFPPPPPPPLSGMEQKLQVSVPDEYVGQMLGRGGENISVIQRHTQTRISVSPRNEFVPGTRDRIVTICGSSYAACREAEAMLGDKLPKI